MKKLIAAAVLLAIGSVAFASANGTERWTKAPAPERAAAPAVSVSHETSAAARVQLAFSAPTRAKDPTVATPALRTEPARATSPDPVSRPSPVQPSKAKAVWYDRDPSLRRGDVVVTETGALVYEGEKGGKRHFRTVGMSRLVTSAERDQILKGVQRSQLR